MTSKWPDHIKDNDFVRNLILLGLTVFILVGVIVLYCKGDLKVEHFYTALDVAIGIVIGTGILKVLKKQK